MKRLPAPIVAFTRLQFEEEAGEDGPAARAGITQFAADERTALWVQGNLEVTDFLRAGNWHGDPASASEAAIVPAGGQ